MLLAGRDLGYKPQSSSPVQVEALHENRAFRKLIT